jgi:hypothetical protein
VVALVVHAPIQAPGERLERPGARDVADAQGDVVSFTSFKCWWEDDRRAPAGLDVRQR